MVTLPGKLHLVAVPFILRWPVGSAGLLRATATVPGAHVGLSRSALGNHGLDHNRSFWSSRVGYEGVPPSQQCSSGSALLAARLQPPHTECAAHLTAPFRAWCGSLGSAAIKSQTGSHRGQGFWSPGPNSLVPSYPISRNVFLVTVFELRHPSSSMHLGEIQTTRQLLRLHLGESSK